MRWEDEQWIKTYTRDTVDWLALSYDARSLFLHLLRKVDRAGILALGRHGRRGVAVLLGAAEAWTTRLEPALAELEADGCVRVDGERLVIPNFTAAQEARSSDKVRKQAQRQRDRDAAMGGLSVTARDSLATMSRAESHDVTPAVTGGHTTSHDVTNRREETREEEKRSSASQGAADADPPPVDEQQDSQPVRPPLELEPTPEKRERKLSAAERLYAVLQESREAFCRKANVPFVEDRWPAALVNKNLGPVAKGSEEDRKRFEAAWNAYLNDDARAAKGWALSYFMNGPVRSQYEQRALAEDAA